MKRSFQRLRAWMKKINNPFLSKKEFQVVLNESHRYSLMYMYAFTIMKGFVFHYDHTRMY